MSDKPMRMLLLVEDSPGDVRLTQEVLRGPHSSIDCRIVSDGIQAMAFLKREGAFHGAPRPDLILLDLNLPKMDGREVLARIKQDDELKSIPTVVLTTSDSEDDITTSYQLQANCYLSKPTELEAYEQLLLSIKDVWLSQARLPQRR